MLSAEGGTEVRTPPKSMNPPPSSMDTTAPSSPGSSVATLAALRGKRLRKYSEADAGSDTRASTQSMRIETTASQLYTKVPLTPISIDDNGEFNFRRQASVRIKKMSSYHDGSTLFPKLNDCAHFHYDHVDLGTIQISMHDDPDDRNLLPHQNGSMDLLECPFTVKLCSQGKVWLVKRCYEDFRVLDKQLHKCIFDRRFSQLVELPKGEALTGSREAVKSMLAHYISRFSQIAGDMINCGPVLNWMELDNHGNHVVASEESAINIPAVAAAHVVKRYTAQAPDEISLEVGDMISVIDMPPPEDTSWWRGKNKFDVGFFPRQCVEIINDKLPLAVAERVPKGPKPVLRKHGKLITFLRSFIIARPTRRRLKQSGILKERVFGCDLGEHLLNAGTDIPLIVKSCAEFIEQYGICDGIYRLSGVASNVQYLRDQFDSDSIPSLDEYKKDIHCVSSVCKLYFRELPNPLLTYQLYQKFEEAAMSDDENRLVKMHDTVQQLPPPHYRTLQFLIRHLSHMSSFSHETGMNIKNLAIVWAPNLLRSKDIEMGSCAAFMEIKVQATVVEYLVKHCDLIFNDKLFPDVPGVGQEMQRPKSLILSTPTKLLSLEEARARSASQVTDEEKEKPKYIEVGGGPAALPKQYHTVIDLPADSRKRLSTAKAKKSPGWRAFFSRSTAGKEVKRKMSHDPSTLRVPPTQKHFGYKAHRASLRSVKSAESLSSSESGTDIHKQSKMGGLYDPAKLPGHLRRSSVACMENTLRRSSSDSFFEIDPDIVAAATKDMMMSRHDEDSLSRDEIFIEEESGARCELGKRRYSGTNSPLWIDQSLSSMESDAASVKSPHVQQQQSVHRQISTDSDWHTRSGDDGMLYEENAHHYHGETPHRYHGESPHHYHGESPPPSPTTVTSYEQRYEHPRMQQISMPQRQRLRASLSMPLSQTYTPEFKDVEMREGGYGAGSPDQSESVLDKISRVMSIKGKAKLKRESSTETDDFCVLDASPDTHVDDVMDRPVMVTVRTQTSPHDTSDDMDTGEEIRRYDVNLQTAGGDVAGFIRTPATAQRRSMNLDMFSNIDEALLGTTAPRPKSIHIPHHRSISRDSEPFDDDFVALDTRLSLDTVLSEYDQIMEKYNNRPLTPEFDPSDDVCKFDGVYGGQRLSGSRHGMAPLATLNSNCNNARSRRPKQRHSAGEVVKSVSFDSGVPVITADGVEKHKRLSAGAVLDRHSDPPQKDSEEVVVVRLRRPKQPGAKKKLYASPERFSLTSPDIMAHILAGGENASNNPLRNSTQGTQTFSEETTPVAMATQDATPHHHPVAMATDPTEEDVEGRITSHGAASTNLLSSIPDTEFLSKVAEEGKEEEEEEQRGEDEERRDVLALDSPKEDTSFEMDHSQVASHNDSYQLAVTEYPVIISDVLEL